VHLAADIPAGKDELMAFALKPNRLGAPTREHLGVVTQLADLVSAWVHQGSDLRVIAEECQHRACNSLVRENT
jgi:hypothetical protein